MARERRGPNLVSDEGVEVCRLVDGPQLARLAGVSVRQIDAWRRRGFLDPVDVDAGTPRYDFQQAAAARTLSRLLTSGASPRRLFRSLARMQAAGNRALPVAARLARLTLCGDRLVIRNGEGRLVEGSGQLLLEFESDPARAAEPLRPLSPGDELFEAAVRFEQGGNYEEAARCYRRLILEEGPNPDVSFNLANVLVALNEIPAAIERLYETVSLDRNYVDAWNNLGNLMAERGRLEDAREAYERACELAPDYGDAQFGLADVLEELHCPDEARVHWREFVKLVAEGPQYDYAQEQLSSGRPVR